MSTRDHIVQQIMLNEVLLKRKATLDQLLDGLCALRFNTLFQSYPENFLKLFCASCALELAPNPAILCKMVIANCQSNEDEATYDFLKAYFSSLDEEGIHDNLGVGWPDQSFFLL